MDILRSNSDLRAEVEAATRLGISLRRFSGWEGEPEWDEDSRAWVLALGLIEASTCSGCGGWLPETTDQKNDGHYHADFPVRCFRCTALHIKQGAYKDDPQRRAQVIWPVRLIRRARG